MGLKSAVGSAASQYNNTARTTKIDKKPNRFMASIQRLVEDKSLAGF